MAQKENQRIALTKKLLQEGLLRLLEVKSLDKISVTELCKESGINRATFYNHYNSPLELLNDIESRMSSELKQMIGTPTTAQEVIERTELVCNYFYDNSRTVLTLNRCHTDQDITNALHDLNQNFQLFHLNSKYTQTLNGDGLYLVTVFFYTGCYNLLLDWLQRDIQKTPKEIAELIIRLASENFLE